MTEVVRHFEIFHLWAWVVSLLSDFPIRQEAISAQRGGEFRPVWTVSGAATRAREPVADARRVGREGGSPS